MSVIQKRNGQKGKTGLSPIDSNWRSVGQHDSAIQQHRLQTVQAIGVRTVVEWTDLPQVG